MKNSKRLVFFGNERLATAVATTAPVLRALVHGGYEIATVVVSHSAALSRTDRRLEIVEVAHAYHIPILIPDKLAEVTKQIKDYKAEAAVLVAFGKIIPQAIIDTFPKGIINIHPSLLPLYRGPTPLETTILDGASETGVSLMQLSAKMDAGPVFARQKLSLEGSESKQELADRLLELGLELLTDNLLQILDAKLTPEPQDDATATYTKLLKKDDGIMDWNQPAKQLEREVRAYLGWPRSTVEVFGNQIIVTKARVAKDENDGALVMPTNPGYLEIAWPQPQLKPSYRYSYI